MTPRMPHYNIAVVAACPFPCARGTPVRVARSAEALAELGHSVHVVTYNLGDPGLEITRERLVIHRIPRIPFYRDLSPGPSLTKLVLLDPLLLLKLNAVLGHHKIDFIYAHHYEALIVALAVRAVKHCPVIYDAHTILETELPDYVSGPVKPVLRKVGKWVDGFLPRRADHIVTVTDEIADRLAAHFISRSRVSVISNGLELAHFMACRWTPESLDSAIKVLIFTGNLAAYQGIDLMLEAFALLRQRRNDVLLRIVTNGDFHPYAPLARKHGIENDIEITSTDFDSLPGEIAKASVAINPRLSMDGIPQKLLNYMAVGVPIVSFSGSARNLVDNVNGLVVPDGDTVMFADALDKLLNDKQFARKLGMAARSDARRAGTWLDVARKLDSVFSGMMAQWAGSHQSANINNS